MIDKLSDILNSHFPRVCLCDVYCFIYYSYSILSGYILFDLDATSFVIKRQTQ
jgi:hypothetical protein